MKDPANHRAHTQRKVLREARQEAEAKALREERRRANKDHSVGGRSAGDESMPVETEEQPLVNRPLQRSAH